MPDLVLRDELLQDLGNVVEVGFVLLKLHPVDQRCQLVHLLPRTLVVASQILRQLLEGADGRRDDTARLYVSSLKLTPLLTSRNSPTAPEGTLASIHRRSAFLIYANSLTTKYKVN